MSLDRWGLTSVNLDADPPAARTMAAKIADEAVENWYANDFPELDPPPLEDPLAHVSGDGRVTRLVRASSIIARRTRWLWADRLPQGTVSILAGPGGVGKSTLTYTISAQITRGTLPGEHFGKPRAVIVSSQEDTWAEVIRPRLEAAGADLDLVFQVTSTGDDISLPRDLESVRELAERHGVVLLVLDPFISRFGKLNTHVDAEIRQGLLPLATLAGEIGMAVIGIMHFNKSATAANVIQAITASPAFTATARSVHVAVPDPEDETGARRLFGTAKNNMGRSDLPTLAYTIGTTVTGQDPDDGQDITASKIEWAADSTLSLDDAYSMGRESREGGTAITEAITLLRSLLDDNGGCVTSKQARQAARDEGISEATLKRAVKRMRLVVQRVGGYQAGTTWTDPASISS